MNNTLTLEQVNQLAPDTASMKRARKLGLAEKWLTLGTNDAALWGEVKGSGKKPYVTMIDLQHGPAYKCSCSSRKIPCKHALALMLVSAQTPAKIPQAAPPTEVSDWLEKRAARLARAAEPIDREAQAKRATKRQAVIAAGLDEIDLWLCDLLRTGLTSLPGKPLTFYGEPARRLIDAQVPGVASRVRALGTIPGSGEGWVKQMLAAMGEIHLLVESFRRFDALPAPLQVDVRAAVGWSLQVNELAEEPVVRDTWLVMGRTEQAQDKLRVQRLWLYGEQTERVALLLDFAHGGTAFDHAYYVGESIEADIVFYPSMAPLRAVVRAQLERQPHTGTLPGVERLQDGISKYAAALAKNPWLDAFPLMCQAVIPVKRGREWLVVDTHGDALPLNPVFQLPWELLAVSGGRPVWLMGEWNGDSLLPLAVASNDAITPL